MTPDIRDVTPADATALHAFFRRVPEGDRTFFKEDVLDDEVVDTWLTSARGRRLVAVHGAAVAGYVAVVPLTGWSSHVGEMRLVVDPGQRGQGVGTALARRALLESLQLGLRKIVVEVLADQTAAIAMFQALGFEAEALLHNHVCDRDGRLHDLLVLAHPVEERREEMAALGIDLAGGGAPPGGG